MTDETGAAAPVEPQAIPQAQTTEQATPEQSVEAGAATENAEQQGTEEGKGEEQPKRRSTSERYRRKISAQAGVIERMAAELEELKKGGTKQATQSELPKPSDYPGGEYDPQYVADLAAIKAEAKISTKLEKRDEDARAQNEREATIKAFREFEANAEKVKTVIADFDETLEAFVEDGGSFAPHVVRRLHKLGERGPAIAYQLAKNPDLADSINAMSPEDAAFEIASIAAKSALPQPKKATQAPKPLTAVTGGAAASKSPAEMSMDEYVRWRKASNG